MDRIAGAAVMTTDQAKAPKLDMACPAEMGTMPDNAHPRRTRQSGRNGAEPIRPDRTIDYERKISLKITNALS